MLTQTTARIARPASWALAGLLALVPALAAAETTGAVTVERIETRSAGETREVLIHTSREPTFSVFRLSEPFRILVDVTGGEASATTAMQKVDDGVVRYVSTQRFGEGSSATLRVEVALDAERRYEVRSAGNSIVVAIAADEGQAVPAAAPALPAATLGKLTLRSKGSATLLSVPVQRGAVAEGTVTVEQVEGPARLVVDVARAEVLPKWQKLKVGKAGIVQARVGTKDEGGVRIVLDLAKDAPVPVIEVSTVKGRLEIAAKPAMKPAPAVASAPTAPRKGTTPDVDVGVEPATAPIAAAPAPAAPTEVVSKATAQPSQVSTEPAAQAASNRVVDVKFEPRDGFVRLTVVLEKDAAEVEQVPQAEESAPSLRLVGTALPQALERTLDVSEVARQVVSSISTYEDGGNTMVAANIERGTEHRHWRKGNKLMWDFRQATTSARAAEPEVTSYAQQATAGFSASAMAADTAGKLGPTKTKYTGRRITLDLKDGEIQNVLRLLADVSKLNIVAADDVSGKVTIKLTNVPWDQALDIILKSKGLDKTRSGNIIRVAPATVLQKEEELRLKRMESRGQLEPLTVRLIPVSYATAAEVQAQVRALLSPRGKLNVDQRTNVLVVEDIAENLIKMERLVRTLDTQTPQVLIEARIVEANTSFTRELGIQWGGAVSATQQYGTSTGLAFPNNIRISGGADDQGANVIEGVAPNPNYLVNLPASAGAGTGGALGLTFGSIGGAALISLRLSAAETMGKVKIVSAPKIVTLDNKEAKILSGEKVPITVITANGPTTRFIDANIELKVTPHVTQDGSILMKIAASKNEISNRVDGLGVPGIFTKEAETEMIVRDGDTAVLGGLYRRTARENEAYVPFLGRIPVLGFLFKNRRSADTREELLIFISPRIVNRSAALVQSPS
jgi:type IV pilus assembly protein PilQ